MYETSASFLWVQPEGSADTDALAEPLPPEFEQRVGRLPTKEQERARAHLQALSSLSITNYEELVARLPELSFPVLETALQALVYFGRRKGLPPLVCLLRNATKDVRVRVPRYLRELRGERAFHALARALREDPDADVRYKAGHQLQFFFDDRQCDLFLEVLQDVAEEPRVRGQAAEGLHLWPSCGDARTRLYKRVVGGLIAGLSDGSPEVRFWCCYALGQLRARAAVPPLQRLIESDKAMCPDWWLVRDEASDAISAINGKPAPLRERIFTPTVNSEL